MQTRDELLTMIDPAHEQTWHTDGPNELPLFCPDDTAFNADAFRAEWLAGFWNVKCGGYDVMCLRNLFDVYDLSGRWVLVHKISNMALVDPTRGEVFDFLKVLHEVLPTIPACALNGLPV